MKNEVAYFVWNLFLLASIIASNLTGVLFPAVIVGVFSGIELGIWILVLFSLTSKSVCDAVNKAQMVKGWRIITEAAMVFSAFYLGFMKIGCAWLMIALLGFSIGELAKKPKNA